MKTILQVFRAALIMALFYACKKSDGPPPQIAVDRSAISLGVFQGYTDSFEIQSNTAWELQLSPASAASWLGVSSTKGNAGKTVVKVSSTAVNTSTQTATISIKPAGGSTPSVQVSVTQKIYTADWNKMIGCGELDEIHSMARTPDGGFVIAGTTIADGTGDFPGGHGYYDGFVTKLTATGTIEWSKTFGGNNLEVLKSIAVNQDGSIVACGYTESSFTGDIPTTYGSRELWVIKLLANGAKLWSKCYGGSQSDEGRSISIAPDGQIVIVGNTYSNKTGDVGQSNGGEDLWILKLDQLGNIMKNKLLGGSGVENAHSVTSLADGSIIVAAITNSNVSGDVGATQGSYDAWILKLDANVNVLWNKLFGGSELDKLFGPALTPDNGFVFTGYSESDNSGDVGDTRGDTDAWILKLDASGNKVWSRTYGGDNTDEMSSIIVTSEGDLLMSGSSYSDNNGDLGPLQGDADVWLLKLNNKGGKVWSKTIGGNKDDLGNTLVHAGNGEFVMAATTYSDGTGDVGPSHGNYDVWLVKFK